MKQASESSTIPQSFILVALPEDPIFDISILDGEPKTSVLDYLGSAMANKYHLSWFLGILSSLTDKT